MISFLLLALLSIMNPEETKLIYVGDPMCSWCYGVSDELSKVKSEFPNMEFELLMGGLRPYNTEVMHDLKDFLSHHWEDVSAKSGKTFSYEILDSKTLAYDTEPPSRATVVVRAMKPSAEFDFFKAAQEAFYVKNKAMNEVTAYSEILEALEIDASEFAKRFESQEMKDAVRADFQRAQEMGVRSFPTLLLKKGSNVTIVASGFKSAPKMIETINRLLAK